MTGFNLHVGLICDGVTEMFLQNNHFIILVGKKIHNGVGKNCTWRPWAASKAILGSSSALFPFTIIIEHLRVIRCQVTFWELKMGQYFPDAEPHRDQVCQVWLQWLHLLNSELSGCLLAPYPSKLFHCNTLNIWNYIVSGITVSSKFLERLFGTQWEQGLRMQRMCIWEQGLHNECVFGSSNWKHLPGCIGWL